jgi:hypothetical protein
MTGAQPLDWHEYPQAIADDYPGWYIQHHNGHRTACCPAITVHATSSAALRAAIEYTISDDNSHDGS